MEPTPFLTISFRKSRTTARPAPRGFTLIEMMVVLAIIVVIIGVTILGQSSFNRSLLLTDTTYTVALSIREAQSLGLASQKYNSTSAGYGAHFLIASPTFYTIFADTDKTASNVCPTTGAAGTPEAKPGNCRYDSADGTVQSYSFTQGFVISRLCGTQAGTKTRWCSNISGAQLSGIDVVFVRPNTDSVITGIPAVGSTPVTLTDATIYVASPDAVAERCVQVATTGQVSVLQACP